MKNITRRQAEAALHAIERQFPGFTEDITLGSGSVLSGSHPTLVENYSGARFAIVWEEGPDEWVYRAFQGGTDEEVYTLAIDAGASKDKAREIATTKSVACPKGVFAEPITSYALGLYPA